MTTNWTDSTKQQWNTAFCYAATWPKNHHVCGVDVALSQTVIRCPFFFPGKTELTPFFFSRKSELTPNFHAVAAGPATEPAEVLPDTSKSTRFRLVNLLAVSVASIGALTFARVFLRYRQRHLRLGVRTIPAPKPA